MLEDIAVLQVVLLLQDAGLSLDNIQLNLLGEASLLLVRITIIADGKR
jgi:DNA-binding transcriptional MerR regulator